MGSRRTIYVGMIVAIGVATTIAVPSQAHSADDEQAYSLALMCYAFASGYGSQADGLRTQDAVKKMGRVNGYSPRRITDDTFTMVRVVGDQIRADPSSVDRNRAICRRLKLIG
jgi:hypothetical protein